MKFKVTQEQIDSLNDEHNQFVILEGEPVDEEDDEGYKSRGNGDCFYGCCYYGKRKIKTEPVECTCSCHTHQAWLKDVGKGCCQKQQPKKIEEMDTVIVQSFPNNDVTDIDNMMYFKVQEIIKYLNSKE